MKFEARAALPSWLEARRSIRSFVPDPIAHSTLATLIEAACIAPAPHHSRPWRWVAITDRAKLHDLAAGMGDQWRSDLARDGVAPKRIDELVDASHRKLMGAPAVILGCVTWNGLDRYPDEARQRAEFGMALLSLGAAVENLMLCAADLGLASCWVASPIFCPDAARDALGLDQEWRPHAMVLVGKPDPNYVGRPRPPVPLETLARFF